MCAITLTTVSGCKHELPTVDYCEEAGHSFRGHQHKRKAAGETSPPPTCTKSLGWMIFSRLEAPVRCSGCKTWLAINGKRTYGGMIEDEVDPAIKKEEDSEASPNARKRCKVVAQEQVKSETNVRDASEEVSEDAEQKPEKLGEKELRQLFGSLSSVRGTTGR